MAVQIPLMTVEEFWKQYANQPYELVNGEVIEIVPTGFEHGTVQSRINARLRMFVDEHKLGEVAGGETGFWLSPNTMRAADVAFVSNERLGKITERGKYLPFAPDLAVEIVSPNDTADEVERKVRIYLSAGTRLVWVVYPELRRVVVHHPDATSKRIEDGESLDGGAVLPGLILPIQDILPPPPAA